MTQSHVDKSRVTRTESCSFFSFSSITSLITTDVSPFSLCIEMTVVHMPVYVVRCRMTVMMMIKKKRGRREEKTTSKDEDEGNKKHEKREGREDIDGESPFCVESPTLTSPSHFLGEANSLLSSSFLLSFLASFHCILSAFVFGCHLHHAWKSSNVKEESDFEGIINSSILSASSLPSLPLFLAPSGFRLYSTTLLSIRDSLLISLNSWQRRKREGNGVLPIFTLKGKALGF